MNLCVFSIMTVTARLHHSWIVPTISAKRQHLLSPMGLEDIGWSWTQNWLATWWTVISWAGEYIDAVIWYSGGACGLREPVWNTGCFSKRPLPAYYRVLVLPAFFMMEVRDGDGWCHFFSVTQTTHHGCQVISTWPLFNLYMHVFFMYNKTPYCKM